ncbi:MAG: polysaccharide deacetylase family protein, partial [Solirubrobacterales bacterium]
MAAASALAAQPATAARAVPAFPSAAERQPVGCVAKGASFRESGWRGSRKVALTFDGGPTRQYTARVLNRLARAKVHSTFFVRGSFIPGNSSLLRRAVREGHEMANHSWSHPRFPNATELSRTTRAIRGATGFTPCLFRAPYGAVNSSLFARASRFRTLAVYWRVGPPSKVSATFR